MTVHDLFLSADPNDIDTADLTLWCETCQAVVKVWSDRAGGSSKAIAEVLIEAKAHRLTFIPVVDESLPPEFEAAGQDLAGMLSYIDVGDPYADSEEWTKVVIAAVAVLRGRGWTVEPQ